jgi:DNA-directed RNA polymerase subunit RPC12/RpoP
MNCCVCHGTNGVSVFGNDKEPFCSKCQAEFYICLDCGWVGEISDMSGWEQRFCPECRSIHHILLEDFSAVKKKEL